SALTNPDPHSGHVHHARSRASRGNAQDVARALPAWIRAQVRRIPPGLRAVTGNHARASRSVRAFLSDLLRALARDIHASGTGLLSTSGCGAIAPARTRASRVAGGRNGAALRRDRGRPAEG